MSLLQDIYRGVVRAAEGKGFRRCPVCSADAGEPCRYTTDRAGVVKGAIRPDPHFYREYEAV